MTAKEVTFGIFGLAIIALAIASIVLSIIGVAVSFYHSIILGIIVLVLEPAPLIVGICWWFGKNIPAELVAEFPNFFVL